MLLSAMNHYTVSVIFKTTPENIPAMKEIITGVYSPSLKENGCKEYRWYHSQLYPGDFLLFMTWVSKDDFTAHVNSPHVQEAERRLATILLSPAPELIWEYLSD
jgi:quinol monooxygenase YgiN